MPLPEELDPNEYKNVIRNLNGTDSLELNQYSSNGSVTYFDSLIFQAQFEKKQTEFTLTMLNTVYTGVFTSYIFKTDDGINGSDNSNSRCTKNIFFLKPAGLYSSWKNL